MLEKYIADKLAQSLGRYIEEASKPEKLQLELLAGTFSLKPVTLRAAEINESLDLPFTVKSGTAGSLEIQLPAYTELTTKPIVLKLDHISLICGPKSQKRSFGAAAVERERQRKQEMLGMEDASHEIIDPTDSSPGWIENLLTTIVANLKFELNDLHIIFEAPVLHQPTGSHFRLGIKAQSLSINSADENWTPKFVPPSEQPRFIHKLCTLQGLQVYWKNDVAPLQFTSLMDMEAFMKNEQIHDSEYLLKPASAALKVKIDKRSIANDEREVPKYDFTFESQSIFELNVEQKQYRQLLQISELLNQSVAPTPFDVFERPAVRPDIFEPTLCREWWRFAATCIKHRLSERRKRRSGDFLETRRVMRLDYIQLFKRKARGSALSPEEVQRLHDLEDAIALEDLLFFRSWARALLKAEKVEMIKEEDKNLETKAKMPWIMKWLYPQTDDWDESATEGEEEVLQDPLEQLEATDRQRIFRDIQYDYTQPHAKAPATALIFRLTLHIAKVSLSICDGSKPIAGLSVDELALCVQTRQSSLKVQTNLASVSIQDFYTPRTLWPSIITTSSLDNELKKEEENRQEDKRQEEKQEVQEQEEKGEEKTRMGEEKTERVAEEKNYKGVLAKRTTDKFLSFTFETNPIESQFTHVLNLQMLPLRIVYNQYLLDRIAEFFAGHALSSTYKEAEIQAKKMVDQTTQFAKEIKKKKLHLDVGIEAPKILLIDDVRSHEARVLNVDLGRLQIGSSTIDPRKSVTEFYDKFNIDLSSVQMILFSGPEQKIRSQLIEKINLNTSVGMRINNNPSLPQFRVNAALPLFSIKLSIDDTVNLMKIAKNLLDSVKASKILNIPDHPETPRMLRKSPSIPHLYPPDSLDVGERSPNEIEVLEHDDIEIESHFLEATLTISKASLLFSVDSTVRLVEISSSAFVGQATVSNHNMNFNIELHDFEIVDEMQASDSEFRYLARSCKPEKTVFSDSMVSLQFGPEFHDHKNLVTASYSVVLPDSPKYFSDEPEHELKVDINTLAIIVSREAVIMLLQYFTHIGGEAKKLLSDYISQPPDVDDDWDSYSQADSYSLAAETPPPPRKLKRKTDSNNESISKETQDHTKEKQELSGKSEDKEEKRRGTKDSTSVKKKKKKAPVEPESRFSPAKVRLRVLASMDSLQLMLVMKNQKVAGFTLSKAIFTSDLFHIGTNAVTGQLGALAISDLSAEAIHKTIFEIYAEQTEGIQFKYKTFDKTHDFPGYDSVIQLKMSSILLTFVGQFLVNLSDYFSEASLLHLMNSTASRAKVRASQVVQNAAKKLTKVELQVSRPRVLLPRNARSASLLELDLGLITVVNTFHVTEKLGAFEKFAVRMSKISIVSKKLNIDREVKILRDLNISTQISKLGPDRNPELPEIIFFGDVTPIQITLTSNQYRLILGIIRENITPSFAHASATPSSALSESASVSEQLRPVASVSARQSRSMAIPRKSPAIQFNLDLKFVMLELVRDDAAEKALNGPIVKLTISDLNLFFITFSDTSLKLNFACSSLSLNDTRENTGNRYSDLIGPSPSQGLSSMLKIHFNSQPPNEAALSILLDRPKMILNPDSLFSIWEFLSPGINLLLSPNTAAAPAPVAAPATAEPLEKPAEPDTNSGSFELRVLLIDATVHFPEKVTLSDTPALVISSPTFLIKNITTKECSITDLSVQKFELNKCIMDDEKSSTSILEPIDFKINLFQERDSQKNTFKFERGHITFSYQDLVTLFNIIKGFSPPKSPSTESPARPPKQSDLLVLQPTNPEPPPKSNQSWEIELGGARLTLIDDCKDNFVPLLDVHLSKVGSEINQSESKIKGFAKVDFYNSTVGAWEPISEAWGCSLSISKTETQGTQLVVQSNERLNINVTPEMANALYNTSQLWQQARQTQQFSRRGPVQAPYLLSNQTGERLSYWTSRSSDAKPLEDGDVVPLSFSARNTKFRQVTESGSETLSVQLMGFDAHENLPLTHVGVFVFPLRLTGRDISHRTLVFESKFDHGNRVLLVRSAASVKNNTETTFEVHHVTSAVQKTLASSVGRLVGPDTMFRIPLVLANDPEIEVCFRPSFSEYGLSSPEHNAETKDDSLVLHACPHPTQTPFYFYVKTQREPNGQRVQTLLPALVVENLLAAPLLVAFTNIYNTNSNNNNNNNNNSTSILNNANVGSGPSNGLANSNSAASNLGTSNSPLKLAPGEKKMLHSVNSHDSSWTISLTIPGFHTEAIQLSGLVAHHTVKLVDDKGRLLYLTAKSADENEGFHKLVVYARYWLINKTGLPLLFIEDAAKAEPVSSSLAAGQSRIENLNPKYYFEMENPQRYGELDTTVLEEPLMFSYIAGVDIFQNRISLRAGNSAWSNGISIENAGMVDFVEVSERDALYQFGLSISLGSGKFFRTKMIHISPRYILINQTGEPIFYEQIDGPKWQLRPGQIVPFHWPLKKGSQVVCLRSSLYGNPSGGFRLDELGDFAVKVISPNHGPVFIRVVVKLEGATYYISFKKQDMDFPPFKIENFTTKPISVQQKKGREATKILPYESVPFTWEAHIFPHKLQVQYPDSKFSKFYSLEKIRVYRPIEIDVQGNRFWLRAEVVADGPTRVLRLTDLSLHPEPLQVTKFNYISDLEVVLNMSGIGISVIDTTPQELMYITLNGILIEYLASDTIQTLEIMCERFQIDNQLDDAVYPVLLSLSPETNLGQQQPGFHLSVVKSRHYESIHFFHYASVLLQAVTIKLDEAFLGSILALGNTYMGAEFLRSSASGAPFIDRPFLTEPPTLADTKYVYLDLLHLNPVQLNVSFQSAPETDSHSIFRTLVGVLNMSLVNIEDAQLNLNGFMLRNPFCSIQELVDRVSRHLSLQLIRQAYKVLGSVDILGNPMSLLSNLGTGVVDFFYEPAQGLVKSPQEFVSGLARGTTSLFKNSMHGIFSTAGKISNSLGKGIATLALDQEYMKKREQSGREKPKLLLEGFSLGVQEAATGVVEGLYGMIRNPINGVVHEGVFGMAKGLSTGVMGMLIKPTVGIFDFATRTAQGISGSFNSRSVVIYYRVRPARYFGPDKILMTYSFGKSFGQFLLHKIDSGRYKKGYYRSHFNTENCILLFSHDTVFYILKDSLFKQWAAPLKAIQRVDKSIDSITFHFRNDFAKDETKVVPIAEHSDQLSIVNMINETYQLKN